MAARTYTIYLHLDESRLRTGLWCPHCNLPSGWEAPLLSITEHGVGQFGVLRRCHDCDSPLKGDQ